MEGYQNLQEFVSALTTPRKIFVMVKSGSAIDELIAQFLPFLQAGDMLIDGGKFPLVRYLRRERELAARDIFFFGCGVSGGEEGALYGPSLMPGGDPEIYRGKIRTASGADCGQGFFRKSLCRFSGENGAGHYVKMVHNGIEYALMEILAEVYDLFRKLYELPPPEIAAIFRRYSRANWNLSYWKSLRKSCAKKTIKAPIISQ